MTDTIVKEETKRTLHILNANAGKGKAEKIKATLEDGSFYMSSSPEDSAEFIANACKEDPDTCFCVYGGDGTVFRAVNALMQNSCNERASLKIVPVGSGNDFVKSFDGKSGEIAVDVMKFNDKYAVNVINMGFDCGVVRRASKYKKNPLVSGKFSYILGVVSELMHKKSMDVKIELTYEDNTTELIEQKALLIAVANGMWYGGGFKAAPASQSDDGLLDVIIINDVSAMKFISAVGAYKKGKHIDVENLVVNEKYKDILSFKRCKAIKIKGCKSVCADGEIFEENEVEISVLPKALNYIKE